MRPNPILLAADLERALASGEDAPRDPGPAQPALPLPRNHPEPLVRAAPRAAPEDEGAPLEPARALVPADFVSRADPLEAALGWAYRLGVPGALLAAPLRKPARLRLLAAPASPLEGDRARGTAIRAGHFLVEGMKLPLAEADFSPTARHAMP